MGGKALSEPSPRLSTPRLLQLAGSVFAVLKDAFPDLRAQAIPWYAEKPDHGDLDILVAAGPGYDVGALARALGAVEVVHNGTVSSIGLQVPEGVFQVDLVSVEPRSYDFSMSYFAYNDMGNLLGRVAHKMGFKLGHLGLSYVLRDPDKDTLVIDEIMITRSWSEALRLLGYNPAFYQTAMARGGFRDLESIFRYVTSSPYVNRDIYLLENRNQKARARDSKRKTYSEFLAWIEQAEEIPAFDWSNKELVRRTALSQARACFPDFAEAMDAASARALQHAAARRRFNGAVVAKITGLTGVELGAVMKEVRSGFRSEDDLTRWALSATSADIEQRVRDCHVAILVDAVEPSVASSVPVSKRVSP